MASADKYESYDIYDYSENELNFKEAVLSKLDIDKTDTEGKKKRYSLKTLYGTKQTARLAKPIFLPLEGSRRIRIAANEKVNIMFSFKNKHCIYRRKDGTIAVVENASYLQDKPPILFDGDKHKEQLSDARVVLIYAVSKKDQESVDKRGIELAKRETILILAQGGSRVVGITLDKKVGIFKSALLTLITEPRLCFSDGMVVNMYGSEKFTSRGGMKSVEEGKLYHVHKASSGLFEWFDVTDGRKISLHCLIEVTVLQKSGLPHHRPIRSVEHADETYDKITDFYYGDTKLSQKLQEPLPQPHLEESRVLHTDRSLQSEQWFHGNMSRQQAEELLRNDGDFLVRHKTHRPSEYVVSFKHSGVANHMELSLKDGCYKTLVGNFKSVRMVVYMHWKRGYPLSRDDKSIRLISPVYRHDDIDTADDPDAREDSQTFDSGISNSDDWVTSKENTEETRPSIVQQRIKSFGGSDARPKQTKSQKDVITVEGRSSEKEARRADKTEEEEHYIPVPRSSEGEHYWQKEEDDSYLPCYTETAQDAEGDNEYLETYSTAPSGERREWAGAPQMSTTTESSDREMGSLSKTIIQQLDALRRNLLLLHPDVQDMNDLYNETYVKKRWGKEYATHIAEERKEANQSTTLVQSPKRQTYAPEREISMQRNRNSHQTNVWRKDTVRAMTQRLEAVGQVFPQSEELYDDTYVEKTSAHQGLRQTTNDRRKDKYSNLQMKSFDITNHRNQEFVSLMNGGILHNLTYMECFVDECGGDIVLPSEIIKVSIPPNALTSGEIIGITIFNDNPFGPNKGPRVCPVISLDPDGLQFKVPINVSIAHCGVVKDTETAHATVHIGRFIEETEFVWEELNTGCTFSDSFCNFTLDHFCFVDIEGDVKGKKIKVIPVAERMLLGEDLLMTCWMLNSNSLEDVKEELRNNVSPSAVPLDTFQEFVILQTKQPLHCNVRSRNEQWTPVAMEQLLPFRQIWHSTRACFKFRHIPLYEETDEQTPLDFIFNFKQPGNHEILFNVRTKLDDLLRSQEKENYSEAQEDEEDILLFTLARRLDKRDCMKVATYFNLSPESVDCIKSKEEIGVALFKELRKRNFYNESSLKDLTTAFRDINLSSFALQIETIFPKRVKEASINVEVPDNFGRLKVTISDELTRDQCMQLLTLWNLTASFKATLEMDDTPAIALLCELERVGLFGKNNLGEVCHVFGELNFTRLCDKIKSYRQDTEGALTKASFSRRRLLRAYSL